MFRDRLGYIKQKIRNHTASSIAVAAAAAEYPYTAVNYWVFWFEVTLGV